MRIGDVFGWVRSLWKSAVRAPDEQNDQPDKSRRLVLGMLASAPAAAAAPAAIKAGGTVLAAAEEMVPATIAKLAPSIGTDFGVIETIHRQISAIAGGKTVSSRQDLDAAFDALRLGWKTHEQGLFAVTMISGRMPDGRLPPLTSAPDFQDLTSAHIAEAFKLAGHAAPPVGSSLADVASCAKTLAQCGFRNATEFHTYLDTQRAAHVAHLARAEALWPTAVRDRSYFLGRLTELLPNGAVKERIKAAARIAIQETIEANKAAAQTAEAANERLQIRLPEPGGNTQPQADISVWELGATEARFGVRSAFDTKPTRAALFHLCQKLALGTARSPSERLKALDAVRPGLTWTEDGETGLTGNADVTIVVTRDPALIAHFTRLAKPATMPEKPFFVAQGHTDAPRRHALN